MTGIILVGMIVGYVIWLLHRAPEAPPEEDKQIDKSKLKDFQNPHS